jgi:hypothetical protein
MLTDEQKKMHSDRMLSGRRVEDMTETEGWEKEIAPWLELVIEQGKNALVSMEDPKDVTRYQQRIRFAREIRAQIDLVIVEGRESERLLAEDK